LTSHHHFWLNISLECIGEEWTKRKTISKAKPRFRGFFMPIFQHLENSTTKGGVSVYDRLRSLLFRLPPETCHNGVVKLMRIAGAVSPLRMLLQKMYAPAPGPAVSVFGLTFPNPVGLSAGYDKDGLGWRGLAALGFGHIELGTVTPEPQEGKPRPRIFRLEEESAIINRMGFPNKGKNFLVRRLQGPRPAGLILGVNIGKHMNTPLTHASRDYRDLLLTFAPWADYITINVSSPNTTGLRDLQERKALRSLLCSMNPLRGVLMQVYGKKLPLLVKISPDLGDFELRAAIEEMQRSYMDGVVVANTSMGRNGLKGAFAKEEGGLSGTPIRKRSTEMVSRIANFTSGTFPIIASGGVMCPEDAREKLDAGANLVQVFTGMIYRGPGLARDIVTSLSREALVR